MSDLAQQLVTTDPAYTDLLLTNGQLSFVDGRDEVRQLLTQRLRTFLGECFLDTGLGIPYVQQIFQKGVTVSIMEGIFRTSILETPGVLAMIDFTMNLTVRNLSVNFTVQTTDGPVTVPLVV